MSRILLVEDEVGIRLTIEDRLRTDGFDVEIATDGLAGYDRACRGGIDLIVLDLMLPKKGGLDVCRDLRGAGIVTPVLMLTARGQVMDRVKGLRTGADDYLVKPFQMLELVARIEALLRRDRIKGGVSEAKIYTFGEIRVDAKQAAVFQGDEQLQLSAKEYQLLLYFVQHPRQALSRDRLLREVWKYQAELSTRTVDVHVGWLRQKVEEDSRNPRWIVTRHGIGYIVPAPKSVRH